MMRPKLSHGTCDNTPGGIEEVAERVPQDSAFWSSSLFQSGKLLKPSQMHPLVQSLMGNLQKLISPRTECYLCPTNDNTIVKIEEVSVLDGEWARTYKAEPWEKSGFKWHDPSERAAPEGWRQRLLRSAANLLAAKKNVR